MRRSAQRNNHNAVALAGCASHVGPRAICAFAVSQRSLDDLLGFGCYTVGREQSWIEIISRSQGQEIELDSPIDTDVCIANTVAVY